MDILIVDDEMDLCNILTLICRQKQFSVSCAQNLRDALVQIEFLPKLVFLDNDLSDGLGLEIIEELKLRSPFTKIVFITASEDYKLKERAFLKGADYYLAKPFHLQGVREILSQLKERKSVRMPEPTG